MPYPRAASGQPLLTIHNLGMLSSCLVSNSSILSPGPRQCVHSIAVVQMLVALIGLGSSSAFNAFLNVGIIGVDLAFGMPIAISLWSGRKLVKDAPWYAGTVGKICNIISVLWVSFSLVLFSMPIAIPVDAVSANYAPVVLVFFMGFSTLWYIL